MKKIILAAAVVAVASMAVASFASASVDRYQVQTGTLTVNLSNDTTHTFQVTKNPCDGSFTGTGTSAQPQYGANVITENIQGTLGNGLLAFNARYTGDAATLANFPGYTWGATNGVGFDSLSGVGSFTVTSWTLDNLVTPNAVKNHGDWVSQNADKNDAAHSCIGMPIN